MGAAKWKPSCDSLAGVLAFDHPPADDTGAAQKLLQIQGTQLFAEFGVSESSSPMDYVSIFYVVTLLPLWCGWF